MKETLCCCFMIYWYITYFIYILVHGGFDAYSFSVTANVYNKTCIQRNVTSNGTGVSKTYDYCPNVQTSEWSKFALLLCNAIFAGGWIDLYKAAPGIVDSFEKRITNVESKNEDLHRQLAGKDFIIASLEGQLDDRRLIVRMTARQDTAQVVNTVDENGSLLTQTRYPDYQTVVN